MNKNKFKQKQSSGFSRRNRDRPKEELVAYIDTHERNSINFSVVSIRYEIYRKPVRDKNYLHRNEDAAPGNDGCLWWCTCGHGALRLGNEAPCSHIERVLDGGPRLFETLAPVGPPSWEHLGDFYVKLTLLGERLLRWRWAAHALRSGQ